MRASGRTRAAMRRRPTVVPAALLVTACAGRPRPLDDPDRWSSSECLARFTLEQGASPLAEQHELGGWREGVQQRFPAAEIDPERQRPVSAAASLRLDGRPIAWWSPTLDAVVLDGAAFAPLRWADATGAPAANAGSAEGSERRIMGRVSARARRELGDRRVIELLLRIEAIQTYWQVGADLCLVAEHAHEGTYRAELQGVHQSLVPTARIARVRELRIGFAVEIDPEGEVSVVSMPSPPGERSG